MPSPTFHWPDRVTVREVGLRDGLQSITRILPTEHKKQWILAAYEAGVREIEVGSFVPPKLLPQLADTAELVAYAKALPGLCVSVLVPNLKGAERAMDSGADAMLLPLSASHAHSLANLRKSPDDVVAEIGAIVRARAARGVSIAIEVGMSTAFGCTLQGAVAEDELLRLVRAVLAQGVDRVGLADTVGYADPRQVGRLFERVRAVAGDTLACGHFHDTRGLGIANVMAALQAGETRFDACLAGIGGCPHAPGASGNVATEDLVYLFASMGIGTGIDVGRLIALRARVAGWLAGESLHGSIARAGLPKTLAGHTAGAPQATAARSAPQPEAARDRSAPGQAPAPTRRRLPLDGLRVVEFTHMVMGPTCGMVLADLGAEVIKVEPIDGDRTRHLLGAGAGFFPMFNRNKKSIRLNLQHPEGARMARRLCATADVVAENFKPGSMAKYGLDYASLSGADPRVIYASLKGFLPGPYDHRTALDEVVQMMGGLAYMTGRPGDPLRAGSSVNDIMGGMFGAIGVLGALIQRGITGKGQEIQSALYENNVFLVGQHMLQYAITGVAPEPMPNRISAWAVYDVFTVQGGEQIFLAAVSDAQWATFCDILGFADLKADPRYVSNNTRVEQRASLLPVLRERLQAFSAADLSARFERAGLPFAPIVKPEELLDDPHLRATGGLAETRLTDGPRAGQTARAALLPLTMDGQRLGLRQHPPTQGQDTTALLHELGLDARTIDHLREARAVA